MRDARCATRVKAERRANWLAVLRIGQFDTPAECRDMLAVLEPEQERMVFAWLAEMLSPLPDS